MKITDEMGLPAACSVLVMKDNKIIHKQSFVYEDTSRYRIASLTKLFTAVGVLMLSEKGLLDLEKDVAEYTDLVSGVDAYQLLSYSAGMPENGAEYHVEFGKKYGVRYSNDSYHFLGKIIENISGMSYAKYMSENLFKPYGMIDSGIVKIGVDYTANPQFVAGNYVCNCEDPYIPASAMYTSINDMAMFFGWLMDGRILENTEQLFYIQRNCRQLYTSTYTENDIICTEGSFEYLGGIATFNSIIRIDPIRSLVMVVLGGNADIRPIVEYVHEQMIKEMDDAR